MKGLGKKVNSTNINRINREIKSKTVRLTNYDGKYIGILSLKEAIKEAKKNELDLIEINPNVDPPVCRIMNYGKFLYKKSKLYKKQKKKQKFLQIKEIKFRPNTDEADYKVKIRNLIKFLKYGNKVKITIRFRGREITYYKLGIKILNRIFNDLINIASIEYFTKKIEGRQMIMILTPRKPNK